MNSHDCLPITGVDASERVASRSREAAETISIACYDNEIPDFVEVELERLYGNIFSSLLYFKIYGGLTPNTSTYVVRNGEVIITIFLFLHQKMKVQVINEGMKIDEEELYRFFDYIFARYRSVNLIYFNAVEATIGQLQYPLQRFNCPGDLILSLPATQKDYFASLGANTRSIIKRRTKQLTRDFPSFRMDFYEGSTADEDKIFKIIDMNRARMDHTKKVYVRSSEEIQRIVSVTRSNGLVGVATIDGCVCGGTIGYFVGSNYLSKIISHDSQYNNYSVGMLCSYLTICECIVRGCKQFNFMDGNNEYKRNLGGILRNLEKLVIYRSRTQLILNSDVAVKMTYGRLIYQARLWVQVKLSMLKKSKTQGNLNVQSKIMFYMLDNFRTLKDHISSLMRRN